MREMCLPRTANIAASQPFCDRSIFPDAADPCSNPGRQNRDIVTHVSGSGRGIVFPNRGDIHKIDNATCFNLRTRNCTSRGRKQSMTLVWESESGHGLPVSLCGQRMESGRGRLGRFSEQVSPTSGRGVCHLEMRSTSRHCWHPSNWLQSCVCWRPNSVRFGGARIAPLPLSPSPPPAR